MASLDTHIHKHRSDPAAFVVWLRDQDGTPKGTYKDDEPIKLAVVYCINLVRSMLTQREVLVAFTKIAIEYTKAHPNSWYVENPEPKHHLMRITSNFFHEICARFPNVFVDYSMKNPNNLGCHSRREWEVFNPLNQSIQINGTRTFHMVKARERSAGKPPNHPDTLDYHRFVFMFTNVILHEISHVYITFLSKGAPDKDTPHHMNAPVHGQVEEPVGESGRWLEQNLFQGTIDYFRDPDNGTAAHQCGLPYLKKESGTHRIKQRKIDGTIKLNFEFPYNHRREPETGLKSMSDLNWEENTDPLQEQGIKEVRGDTVSS